MKPFRTIAVVTGTRAEFGLLRPVMRAIDEHESLRLQVIAAGAHLLPPAYTVEEVRAAFSVCAEISMQEPGRSGRDADAAALGRGISGFAAKFREHRPDVVLVLGDRIEAFAAAAAASVAGIHVAHVHGGDRAEGIADESLRHAITKLAHIHFPATRQSAQRLEHLGEPPARIIEVGSPAIDDLDAIPSLDDEAYAQLSEPEIVVLHHPCGRDDTVERAEAEMILDAACELGRVLVLHPNHDAGREGIMAAVELAPMQGGDQGIKGPRDQETRKSVATGQLDPLLPRSPDPLRRPTAHGGVASAECRVVSRPHLPREELIGLFRRVKCLAGNSSAGLIECAAVGLPVVNIGHRQRGRECAANVIDVPEPNAESLRSAITAALSRGHLRIQHPFGDGLSGRRIAASLASLNPDAVPIRKRNTY